MILKFNPDIFCEKRDLQGEIIALLDGQRDDRHLHIETHYARSLKKYDIHEMMVTDEPDVKLDSEVNRIGYLCFFEVTQGAHIILGDEVWIAGKYVGSVVGFDDIHMPNHMNVIVQDSDRTSAKQRGLLLGDKICICSSRNKQMEES